MVNVSKVGLRLKTPEEEELGRPCQSVRSWRARSSPSSSPAVFKIRCILGSSRLSRGGVRLRCAGMLLPGLLYILRMAGEAEMGEAQDQQAKARVGANDDV